MKDIFKFAGASLMMIATLILLNLVFIQSFMGDYEAVNIALTVIYSLLTVAALVYEGLQRGMQDCKYAALIERQVREHDHAVTPVESARLYKPAKGFLAGLIAGAPALILSVAALFFGPSPDTGAGVGVTLATRMSLGAFLGVFQYVSQWVPWIYIVLALIYPASIGAGYLGGPWMWRRQVAMMEKAKRMKRRRVARKKKAKKPV